LTEAMEPSVSHLDEVIVDTEQEEGSLRAANFLAHVREVHSQAQAEATRVCIVVQHTPDPDALGSALGLAWLLEVQEKLSSDIYYAGEVSHPQNKTEINVLDIRLHHLSDFEASRYFYYVVVDSVPQNTGDFQHLVPEWHAVIDHHQFEVDTPYADVRPVGSCSTLIWEYLKDLGMDDFSTERGQHVATALLFGLVNDTQGLTSENVCQLDLAAHAALIPFIDKKRYQDIVQHPLPPYLFELRAKAAESMLIDASALISYLGRLTEKRRDALPIIADEFLRMEGIETVVVFALIGSDIQASVRSSNSSVNVHTFCQKLFGPKYGGGKQGAGGARVPIGFLYSAEDSDLHQDSLSEFVCKLTSQRIVRYLSGA
jgi:nanoRNase/pAp phosphatase (c-di-AMP/oligoRNAs hydrolase)